MKIWALFLLIPAMVGSLSSSDKKDHVRKALREALLEIKNVKKINNEYLINGTDKVNDHSAEGLLDLFTKEEPEAKLIESLSKVALESARKLITSTGLSFAKLTQDKGWIKAWQEVLSRYCQSSTKDCDKSDKYRTIDGSCNNVKNPDWGKAFSTQLRFSPSAYDDDVESPRKKSVNGGNLPSARFVSNILFRNHGQSQHHSKHTVMVMAWGQFVDHDITKTPATQGEKDSSIHCCPSGSQTRSECFEIDIPNDDPYFKSQRCMNLVRSAASVSQDCVPGPREQINAVTAYVDGSNVYGSTDKEAMSLREMAGGRLKVLKGDMPPKWLNSKCRIKNPHTGTYCMHAGDGRVNVVPNLSALHITFIREHNRLVKRLAGINSHWDDDRLYQEARKIMAAYMQQFTYREYLPTVLNRDYMTRYVLYPGDQNYVYRPDVNAGVRNAFSTASFRFGHSQISDHVALMNEAGGTIKKIPIEHTYHDPEMLEEKSCKSNCPAVSNWMGRDTCTKSDRLFDSGVRDKLFMDSEGKSFDLGALNIQRGRDHGLPSYTTWRKKLGLSEVTSFDTLVDHAEDVKSLFKKAYRHVDDIDLFAGGMSEKHIPGGDVGPTFATLIAKQFRALKEGDRFWYENGHTSTGFTANQIKAIKSVSLAKIICENMALNKVQPKMMYIPEAGVNDLVSCQKLKDLNIDLWREQK